MYRQQAKRQGDRQERACLTSGRYAEALEANNHRVQQNPDYYRQRQQIIEHIFVTLKRQRGFTYTLVKGKEKVMGEVGLMFIGYNLLRCVSILGIKEFIKALKECCLPIFRWIDRLILSHFKAFFYDNPKFVNC